MFVGRERQLAELMTAVDELERGRGSLVVLRGEPGIGKTWLADEGAARAAERGAHVLAGRCWESGGAPAYWPWVQCLRKLVEQTEPDTLAAWLGASAADVARIVPELRERIPGLPSPPTGEPEGARFRLFDAVTTLLRNAVRDEPIVLVLDDLHAADAPSLLLLRFVTDALADMPLLVIATRRESDPAEHEGFAATLAELARSERFHDVALGGLGQAEVARLVRAPAELVSAIYERTEGHPFFVAELVRLLASDGRLDAIPPGVRAVVAHRLGLLSEDCRRVLAAASVAGREFRSDVLEGAADHLSEAVSAHVLVSRTEAPGHYRFAHALFREVLYDELPATDRMRLHRAVGEALEASYAPELDRHVAELAHHFFLAGDGKAVDYAARAASRALAGLAYEEAARLYHLAVSAHERDPGAGAPVRCELLLGLATAQASAGDVIAAKDTFVRAAEVARGAGLADHLARAALGLGGSHVTLPPDDPRVLPLLEEALTGETGDAVRARLLARLACAAWRPSLSLEAVELARRLGDPATLAWTLHARVPFLWVPDELDELLALSGEMIAAAERVRDVEQGLDGHLLRFWLLVALGRTAQARDELAVAARLARELRLPSALWHVAVHETELALLTGSIAEADARIDQALQMGERFSRAAGRRATAVVQRFPVRLEQGRLEELRPALEAIAAADPQTALYRCLLARLECEAGDHAAARAMVERLAVDDWAALERNVDWLLAVCLLAETTAILGDRQRASELHDVLAPYTEFVAVAPHRFPIGVVARYVGLLDAALSRPDAAAQRLEAAVERNAAIGAHVWAAHAKADLARIRAR